MSNNNEEIKTVGDLCVVLEKEGISKEESLEALVEGVRRNIRQELSKDFPPELLIGIL